MAKMTEKELLVSQLYRRLLKAQQAHKEGKRNKDYESIIYDLREQINELTNNNLSDGIVSLRILSIKNNITIFNIIELKEKEKIGEARVYFEGKRAQMNYNLNIDDPKNEYGLRTIKLLCNYMEKNGIEEVRTKHEKENNQMNSILCEYGARKNFEKISPYVEHIITLKK